MRHPRRHPGAPAFGHRRRFQAHGEAEQQHGLECADGGVEQDQALNQATEQRRAGEHRRRPLARLHRPGRAPQHQERRCPERQPGQETQGTGGRGDLDDLAAGVVMGLGDGAVTGGVAAEHRPEVLRAPAQHGTRREALEAGLPGHEAALDARPLEVERGDIARHGVVEPQHGGAVGGGDAQTDRDRGNGKRRERGERDPSPAAAREDRVPSTSPARCSHCPREVGIHFATGKRILAGIGWFGP